MNGSPQEEWRGLALRASNSVLLGRLLSGLRIAALGAGIVLFGAGLWLRWQESVWTWVSALLAWSGTVMLAGGIGFAVLWRRCPAEQRFAHGLQRLDAVLYMHNALVTAASEVGSWPACAPHADHRFRLAWGRIFPFFAAGAILAVAGALVPFSGVTGPALDMPPPRSHGEVGATIAELQKAGVFDQKQLDELQQQLDALKNKPAAEWYSHSNIEAADHLQAGMMEQLRSLQSNLEKAAGGLETLQSPEAAPNSDEQQQAAANFKSAMEKIKAANPGLNEKLMQTLSKMDPGALKSLGGKDLQDALDQMKKASGACRNCLGKGGDAADAESELQRMLGGNKSGKDGGSPGDEMGDGDGDQEGEGTGKGGVQRGPGVAPLPLSDSPTDLGTSNVKALENPDRSRTNLGDTVGTSETEHKLDRTPVGPQEAGGASGGKGGESVIQESLLPSEKALLKGIFK